MGSDGAGVEGLVGSTMAKPSVKGVEASHSSPSRLTGVLSASAAEGAAKPKTPVRRRGKGEVEARLRCACHGRKRVNVPESRRRGWGPGGAWCGADEILQRDDTGTRPVKVVVKGVAEEAARRRARPVVVVVAEAATRQRSQPELVVVVVVVAAGPQIQLRSLDQRRLRWGWGEEEG